MRLSHLAAIAAFLSMSLLARADAIDDFTIVGGGKTILFSLPASTTGPASQFSGSSVGFTTTNGSVNGVPNQISLSIIYPGPCAVCNTLVLNTGFQPLYLDLPNPSLYTLSYSSMTTGTFSFISGSYTTDSEFPLGGPTYSINIVPEATAITPEPSSLLLLGTGVLSLLYVKRTTFRCA